MNRDLDRAGSLRPDLPKRGGARVAEESLGAARKHGRHPAPGPVVVVVADKKNPAMKAAQAAGPQPV
jgi:hypothetical protein